MEYYKDEFVLKLQKFSLMLILILEWKYISMETQDLIHTNL